MLKYFFWMLLSALTAAFGQTGASDAQKWNVDVTLRAFWIDEHSGAQKCTATAMGGFFGGRTPEYAGFGAAGRLYVSQGFSLLNPSGDAAIHTVPYDGKESFAYVGEAELIYRQERIEVRAGRIKPETPYADADDNRMVPNTFEGASLRYGYDAHTAVSLLYLTRWAGTDSMGENGNQSQFKVFTPGSKGMAAFGADYTPDATQTLRAWYYHADRLYQLLYLEASGRHAFERWQLAWGVQGTWIEELDASGIGGSVVGATAALSAGEFYATGAYNYADVTRGHHITDGFGGGPYYTSLDESTVAAASEMRPGYDVSVWRLGLGADLSWWKHTEEEGLHLEVFYGQYDLIRTNVSVAETDLIVRFAGGRGWRFDAIVSDFDARNCPEHAANDFKRAWVRLDYTF